MNEEWFVLSILKIFLPALLYYSSIFKQVRKEFFKWAFFYLKGW